MRNGQKRSWGLWRSGWVCDYIHAVRFTVRQRAVVTPCECGSCSGGVRLTFGTVQSLHGTARLSCVLVLSSLRFGAFHTALCRFPEREIISKVPQATAGLYMPPPQSQLHGLESHPLPDFQSRPAGAGSHNAVSPPESTLDRLTHFNLTRIFG